ncbi:hypothetical protein L0666_10300 [Octadecabacter sp. CECT 8868]|uniref:hypothetical protein n=1 Tax=Octadecabacter algicola TaxID=2909342 RepID=UPI001F32A920|nr:hypothetical protein [Octadecabacter algicola]MCF2905382.1 hypothetical protein [Octadecabacter algicola]
MRAGYDLPPMNSYVGYAEAISVGLALISRASDRELIRAARLEKLVCSDGFYDVSMTFE